ncbi:MAG: NifB/NifX family molybdenum-iron cluster-binding protein [Bacilli bacterium]|nr:NifB/NifX family molybdenum-iron cluster-binding protein [Bacilli bacterium]
MKLAICYNPSDNTIFQHFGQTEHFLIVDTKTGERSLIDNGGNSHKALVLYLKGLAVDTVIAGGMGDRAIELLKQAGINVIPGVRGSAEEAIKAFEEGKLEGNFNVIHKCDCDD